MSKGLEALKELKENGACTFAHGTITFTYLAFTHRAEIIEQELKEYEMEHTLRIRLENINYELVREKQENEKKLKALEIIKNKRVVIPILINSANLKAYNEYIMANGGYVDYLYQDLLLTQEEFDLLKEVLL